MAMQLGVDCRSLIDDLLVQGQTQKISGFFTHSCPSEVYRNSRCPSSVGALAHFVELVFSRDSAYFRQA